MDEEDQAAAYAAADGANPRENPGYFRSPISRLKRGRVLDLDADGGRDGRFAKAFRR